VPADLTLAQLHDVLQVAVGWEDGHLHEFSAGGRHFGPPDPEDQFMVDDVEDERRVRVFSLLGRTGAKAIYTYDFGDTWEHSIVLEKRLPAAPTMVYPICIDGQLACPPEDCGCIPGFYDLLNALRDPIHEQHEELQDWVGHDFNPEAFSIEAVNRILTRLLPRRTTRSSRRAVVR
jgi:Plasmid pRiA4b ORF-3-like protein